MSIATIKRNLKQYWWKYFLIPTLDAHGIIVAHALAAHPHTPQIILPYHKSLTYYQAFQSIIPWLLTVLVNRPSVILVIYSH